MEGVLRFIALCAALLALMIPAMATAQERFDPRAYQRRIHGSPTQILVLGTPHLSGTPDGWDPAVLAPLLDRLAAFRPDVIAIETLSGQAFSALWTFRSIHGDAATTYGNRLMMVAAAGSAGTGLDMPQAEAEARRLLAEWPATPTPAQRRRLAAVFAAAGDHYSALVQWWRLDPAERRAGDGVNATLAAQLDEYERRRNENHYIGVRLAARLGLERVFPTDAQDDDTLTPQQMEEFERSLVPGLVAEFRANPALQPLIRAAQELRTPDEVMTTYRTINRPTIGRLNADGEWLRVIDRPTPGDVGRVRTAGWEARNLRMAANIREAASRAPGGRVLVIVGSGHKPWLDAYLAMMSDVAVVDPATVLR